MISRILNQTKSIVSILMLTMILFSSCTDNFVDYNRNTGEPTDEEMDPYLTVVIFSQMIDNVYSMQENSYQMNENLIGDPYGRHLSITNKGFTTPFSTFNANSSWLNYPFDDVFTKFYGPWYKLLKQEGEYQDALLQWASILRVATMHRLADMYGPIPYSQIGKGINTPYDSVEDLYKNMLTDLDNSIEYLTKFVKENPDVKLVFDPEKADVVYKADFKKWIAFANSLKLRLAMRVVYAAPDLAKTKAEEAVKHEFGVITSNDDIPKYVFSAGPNGVYQVSSSWGDSKPAADIVSYMKGYEDPRLPFYFSKAELLDKDSIPYPGIDYLGIRTGIILDEKPKMMTYSGDMHKANSPSIWMTAAEVAFLRSEGALRGWSMGGIAKDLYEEGVRLSFNQWGAGGVDEYLQDDKKIQANYVNPHLTENPNYKEGSSEPKFIDTSIDAVSKITIKWNDAADFEENLERIITQKWIAIYPLGTEAWSEHRRTGYPRFFPVMVNSSDEPELTTKLASRIPFAPNEKQNNQENYEDAVKKLGGPDKYGTRLWWDKKPNKPNW